MVVKERVDWETVIQETQNQTLSAQLYEVVEAHYENLTLQKKTF